MFPRMILDFIETSSSNWRRHLRSKMETPYPSQPNSKGRFISISRSGSNSTPTQENADRHFRGNKLAVLNPNELN